MTRTTKTMRKMMKIVMTMTPKVGTKPMRMRMRERTTIVMPVPDLVLLVGYLWSTHWFFADENENKYSLHPI